MTEDVPTLSSFPGLRVVWEHDYRMAAAVTVVLTPLTTAWLLPSANQKWITSVSDGQTDTHTLNTLEYCKVLA